MERINRSWGSQRRGKQVAQNRDKTMGRSHRPVIVSKREAYDLGSWREGHDGRTGRKGTIKIKSSLQRRPQNRQPQGARWEWHWVGMLESRRAALTGKGHT